MSGAVRRKASEILRQIFTHSSQKITKSNHGAQVRILSVSPSSPASIYSTFSHISPRVLNFNRPRIFRVKFLQSQSTEMFLHKSWIIRYYSNRCSLQNIMMSNLSSFVHFLPSFSRFFSTIIFVIVFVY